MFALTRLENRMDLNLNNDQMYLILDAPKYLSDALGFPEAMFYVQGWIRNVSYEIEEDYDTDFIHLNGRVEFHIDTKQRVIVELTLLDKLSDRFSWFTYKVSVTYKEQQDDELKILEGKLTPGSKEIDYSYLIDWNKLDEEDPYNGLNFQRKLIAYSKERNLA